MKSVLLQCGLAEKKILNNNPDEKVSFVCLVARHLSQPIDNFRHLMTDGNVFLSYNTRRKSVPISELRLER